MSFDSLQQILNDLQAQSGWNEQPFQCLLKCWSEVVGNVVAPHTRPLSIQRDILWVATSSAVWSQELSFRRHSLLKQLNTYLPQPLVDIRFSTAQWQRPQDSNLERQDQATKELWQEHPSSSSSLPLINRNVTFNSHNPHATFQNWAKLVQARSHDFPLCPQCQCPTPPGELERWAICSICAARQW